MLLAEKCSRTYALFSLAAILIFPIFIQSALGQISCAPKPPSPPKRISAGEGFAPLPLPVTPLRRTERKRPPAPPTLVAKANLGMKKVMHNNREVWQWVHAAGDMHDLFQLARRELKINYKSDVVRMEEFNYSPESVPIMYMTSREGFVLNDAQRKALRRYVLDGGVILAAAGSGNEAFTRTFRNEMRKLFFDRPWHVFPADHPMYRSHHVIVSVTYRRGASDVFKAPPQLEGINIGTRAAIILSPADLSCGWNRHTHPEGLRVMPEDAQKIGINVLAYVLAYYRIGRLTSVPVMFKSEESDPGDVRVGQIMHAGDWDPSPSGLQHFLRQVSHDTSAGVNYRREAIDLENADLYKYPFLYLTGLLDFKLSDKAASNLKQYLDHGGFLLVSNSCNRKDFDRAVRREIGKLYSNQKLKLLPATHAVYSTHHNLASRAASTARLEGLASDKTTNIIYSPGSIGSAWDGESPPFVKLPDPAVARAVGVNALVYAMTH